MTAAQWVVDSLGRTPSISRVRARLSAETLVVASVLLIAALVHGINMAAYPYYENDEGTYVSQAWSLITQGQLAPYTYWYDHAPLGWVQLAIWNLVTGGFHTFGLTVESGRVFMLVTHLISTYLVYRIARVVSGDVLTAVFAALVFGLSSYGLYYHRRVLLDNITVPWLLGSILILLAQRVSLLRVWLSGLVLGVAVLTKELTIFVAPAVALLVAVRVDRSQRWFAVIGWGAIVGSFVSLYPLMAALKGELFPTGTLLGGTNPHVSLLDALSFQSSREKDGGILEAGSQFWTYAADWINQDPLLVGVGSATAVLSLLVLRRQPIVGLLGITTLLLWLFLARGGLVLPFYLVPLLPLLALNAALTIWYLSRRVAPTRLPQSIRGPAAVILQAAFVALAAGIMISGHLGPALATGRDPLEMWRSTQALAQQRSLDWVRDYLPPTATVMLDDAVWTDLRDGPQGEPTFANAHWYWKIGLDPEIRDGVFENDWRTVDYVMVSGQLRNDVVAHPGLELPRAALDRSTQLMTFNTGGWPIDIHRVNHVQRLPVADDTLLLRLWDDTRSMISSDETALNVPVADRQLATGLAMFQAVYAGDRLTFERAFEAWQQIVESGGRELVASQYVALSLAFAGETWLSQQYRSDAAALLAQLWDEYALETPSGHVLGMRGTSGDHIAVPVTAFMPFAYHVFDAIDLAHPWSDLREDGYQMLGWAAARRSVSAAGVLPDTILLSAKYGHVVGAGSNVSGRAAAQLTWQVALDSVWTNDGRAGELLARFDHQVEAYVRNGELLAAVNLDGTPVGSVPDVGDAALRTGSVLLSGEPEAAHRLLGEHVLRPLLARQQVEFLDRSWAWLATALLNGGLADLTSGRVVVDWRGDF